MKRVIVSTDQIIKAAGKQRFEAGERSFEQSKVKEFQANEKQASGAIEGYQTQIRYRGETVEGSCNCEESDGFDFCRHCVHLTLHANKIAQQLLSLSKGPDKSKVLAYLINQDKQALAKQLLELIEQDNELFQRYLLRASLDTQEIDFTALKSRITEVTRLKDKLFSQRQIKHFFTPIEHLLEELLQLPLATHADKCMRLVVYAIKRINQLLEKLDDRADQKKQISETLNLLYQQLFEFTPGRPETRAKHYFELWLDDRFQLISDSMPIVLNSPELIKNFDNMVSKAWANEKIDTKVKAKLSRYLLEKAVAEQNLSQEQLYRTALANSTEDWLAISQRWKEAGEIERAIATLDAQLQNPACKETGNEALIISALLPLLQQRKNPIAPIQKLFADYPLLCADTLMEEAGRLNGLIPVRQQAIDALQQRNQSDEQNLLLKLLIEQGQLDEAYQLSQKMNAELTLVIALARAMKEEQILKSLSLYEQALKVLIEKQLGKTDLRAAELLKEVDQHLGQHTQTREVINGLRPLLNKRPRILQLFHELSNEA